MRLTYSHVYPDDNNYNIFSGNASNNLKKKFTIFCEIIRLFS